MSDWRTSARRAQARRERLAERHGVWSASDCPEMFGDNLCRRCVRCGIGLTGRQQRWCSAECVTWYMENHVYTSARRAAQRTAKACALCGGELSYDCEIDHIVAAMGAHSIKSCLHHQSNLRPLHRECHKRRTALQRTSTEARE